MIKRRAFGLLAILVIFLIMVSACQQATPPATPVAGANMVKVAVLFPDEVIDKSWNEAGYNGLLEAQKQCNVQGAYSEKVKQAEQVEIMRNYAQQGNTIIIGHGGEYMDAAKTVAAEFPEIQFVVSNGTKAEKNVTSMAVGYPEMGYLAGVLACNYSKTHKIALVMAEPIPLAEAGLAAFELGAKTCNNNTEVKTVVVGSWSDVNKAREAALVLIDSGVDVLWHIADDAGTGVISAAQDKGVYAIGLYNDQQAVAPKAIIGSAIGSPSVIIYEAACGNLDYGKVNYLSVHNGVELKMTDLVPQEVKDKVNLATEDLKKGVVKVNPW